MLEIRENNTEAAVRMIHESLAVSENDTKIYNVFKLAYNTLEENIEYLINTEMTHEEKNMSEAEMISAIELELEKSVSELHAKFGNQELCKKEQKRFAKKAVSLIRRKCK